MPDIKIITLVKNEIKEGTKESDIYDKLTRDGYNKHQVIEAIDYVNKSKKKEDEKPSISLTKVQIILVIGAILILGCAFYYLVFYDKSDTSNEDEIPQTEVPVEPEVPTRTEFELFEEKFQKCEATEHTSNVIDGSVYHYKIIGLKDGLCEVESRFIENPNSELIDAEMICLYDNTLGFNQAVLDTSRCSGRLYNLIIGPEDDEPETCETTCNNCRLGKQLSIQDPNDNSATICLDCRYDEDCIDDFECFTDNTCINRQIISISPACVNMGCSDYPCENCMTGYRTCQSSTIEYKNNKCIECGIDSHCKDGYRCEEYFCVIS